MTTKIPKKIAIYDTTLRDGSQAEDISFSLEDKIRIAKRLDEIGIHYIEGGWPGSNPKDTEFFKKIVKWKPVHSKICAFGSTKRHNNKAEEDPNLCALLKASTPVVTIFGKSWDMHVSDALNISLEHNLELISDSVEYLKSRVNEVIYDAEHFFDGYKLNPAYALKTIRAAEDAGADYIVLCDTNGGTLPYEIALIFKAVRKEVAVRLGIHTHNDTDTAVSGAIEAVLHGAEQVHGTINGFGERCGNANLCSLIPNIKLKLKLDCISLEQLSEIKDVSCFVNELANLRHTLHQPYVGKSAFAHKGGIHVSAVKKNTATYEHINPELVGNHRRVLVSELSGKSNIIYKAEEYGIDIKKGDTVTDKVLQKLKELESEGFQFEGAEASFELMMKEAMGEKKKFFTLMGFRVIVEKRKEHESTISEATIKIKVNGEIEHTVSEGNGPVNALDNALRKGLEKFYPELREMKLIDYKVRILDERVGTKAKTRVLIESGDNESKWGTVGISDNIIEASWQALSDGIEYKLNKERK